MLQSTIQLKPLAARLKELDLKACAITDYGNLYGALGFYNALKAVNVKPIIGYEANFVLESCRERSSSVRAGERPYYSVILLAENNRGYQNLVSLASKAFTDGYYHRPRVDLEMLSAHHEGLIGLSGGLTGVVGHFLAAGDEERAFENAKMLEEALGRDNFFLEICEATDDTRRHLLDRTVELSTRAEIDLVATNDVHYLHADDARAHELLQCLKDGRTLVDTGRPPDATWFLRSAAEMWEIFGNELPSALQNTVRIAERCEIDIPQGELVRQLPDYPTPIPGLSMDDYLVQVLNESFAEREAEEWRPKLADGTLVRTLDEYRERLDSEIRTIQKMGFSGYFLIVWDFIRFAREKGIPVGPGRGSAAGSLAAYCLRITDVDPLQYDLLFERFLNPHRISMPDIDIDFCIRGRGDVIRYVTDLYGQESVCQIITFGTMASRAAIKDVGRTLGMDFGSVERIAKMIPKPVRGRNVSIPEALETVPELKSAYNAETSTQNVIDLALKLEGCSRHTSVHAAGVVISPKPLHELVPVKRTDKDEFTSQFPMGDLEKVGMLKMDFLGLTTLTIIADTLASIRERHGIEIDWAKVPTTDEQAMQLFADGRTEAIFQFESSGMQELCRRLKPKVLEDLSALNALYRPGPIDGGMVDDFIDRHKGTKPVEYILPEMEGILGNTFGVLVYQEQIMQLAQKLAGYSLGQADLMRRAMGKKNVQEMSVHEQTFISGAVENKIPRKVAKEIFDLMAKFADYGFNRSHSMAYAVLAFRTAYLKAHYPADFYAAVLSHESDDSEKVYKYTTELKSLGLSLLPPDINESGDGFTPVDETVRYGLMAIKGLGASSVEAIVSARSDGKFSSLFDFCGRLSTGAVNRRGLESLICAGAFDSLMAQGDDIARWRASNFAAVDLALAQGQRLAEDRMRGQTGLFASSDSAEVTVELPDVEPWRRDELGSREKAAVGFYISTHPIDSYQRLLEGRFRPIAEFSTPSSGDKVRLAGMLSMTQVKLSKRGGRYCTFRLEDRSGGIKGIVFARDLPGLLSYLKDDELVIAEGTIEVAEGQEPSLRVDKIQNLVDEAVTRAREVCISLPPLNGDTVSFLETLYILLERERGQCGVVLEVTAGETLVQLRTKVPSVAGSRELQRQLEERGCSVEWLQ
ncbi:MAG: DNA polymerase III subunit alpha [Chloracidobacterium sp.]|nr:DNA polymerase III subunit alpha [Chloracidobacterium sp.]